MKLRVEIVCPDCNQSTEVHILGDWDIKSVAHDCPHWPITLVPPPVRGSYQAPFRVTFEPPRRAY